MSKTALVVTVVVAAGLGLAAGYAIAVHAPELGAGTASQQISPAEAGARAREILADADALHRVGALAQLLQRAGPDALPAVREAFDAAPIDGGDVELVLFATWWARFDPEAAVAWTTTDWRAKYGSVLMAVYRTWAHRDPQQALERARKLRSPVQRKMSVEAAWAGWDESGLPGLVEAIRALPEMVDRQEAAQVLAHRRVAALGAEEALHWAEALPEEGGFRSMVRARVASAVAWRDPAVAADWARPQITSGDERPSGLARRIGTRWVRSDPEAAMAWLESLPAGEDRDDGVTETFRDWIVLDADAAFGWIQGRSMEPWLEPAFSLYARSMTRDRPKDGLELAARITDEDLRNMTTTVIARSWLRADRAAAEAWLADADIPEVVRKRVEIGASRPGPKVRQRARARALN